MVIKNTELESEYPFLQNSDILFDNFVLTGKYYNQYFEKQYFPFSLKFSK